MARHVKEEVRGHAGFPGVLVTPPRNGHRTGGHGSEVERGLPRAQPQEVQGIEAGETMTAPAEGGVATTPVAHRQPSGAFARQEAWGRIEMAVAQELAKPLIEDGHDEIEGRGAELSVEIDQQTAPDAGTGSETAYTVETSGQPALEEVEGYVEPPPPVTPDALEIVHGSDDRVRVGVTTAYPFRTICQLEITAPNGKSYIGSGAFIGPRVVLTAGHCVFMHADGGWARQIRVIPGRNGTTAPFGSAIGTSFRSVLGWTRDRDGDHDYAVIVLPTRLGATVGWMGLANLSLASLLGLNVNNSGYPGDKPYGTQWWNANNVLAVTGRRLYYRIDTMGGQSGSPVWRFKDGQRHIVGIHTTGGSPFNAATRICDPVFANLVAWKDL